MDSLRDTKLPEDVKREVGQHFIFGFHGHEVSPEIESLIRHGYLNNVILMKRNIKDAAQTRRVVRMLQQIAKEAGHERPLMIGIDQENGLVSAFSVAGSDAAGTQFPGAMALAATGSTGTTEEVYRASAEELKLVGINWAFSPVADVNSDPQNPVIGARSFGDDPKAVGQHVFAATQGLSDAAIAASLKHFPGHGTTATDSHLALPIISRKLEDLKAVELIPFAASLSAPSVMTGHIALPELDGIEAEDVPASLSARVTSILRNELEYNGVIVTDCLEMAAVAAREGGVPRGAVQALQAGADVVMICHTHELHFGSLEATYKAVLEGELDIETLRASGRRIAALKDRFAGSWADVLPEGSDLPPSYDSMDVDDGWATAWADKKASSADIAQRAYAATTAVLRDPKNIMQRGLRTSDKVLLVTPTPQSLNLAVDDSEGVIRTPEGRLRNTAGASYLALANSMRTRLASGNGALTHIVATFDDVQSGNIEILSQAKEVDRVVFATRDAHRGGSAWQKTVLERLFDVCGNKMVVLSTCAPYDVIFAKHPWVDEVATLATFEYTAPALEAAVAVLFKEKEASGKTPVAERYVRHFRGQGSGGHGQAPPFASRGGHHPTAGPRAHHHNFRPLQQPAASSSQPAAAASAPTTRTAPPPAALGSSAPASEELRAAMNTLIQAANSGQGPVSPQLAQELNTILGQMDNAQSGISGTSGGAASGAASGSGSGPAGPST